MLMKQTYNKNKQCKYSVIYNRLSLKLVANLLAFVLSMMITMMEYNYVITFHEMSYDYEDIQNDR